MASAISRPGINDSFSFAPVRARISFGALFIREREAAVKRRASRICEDDAADKDLRAATLAAVSFFFFVHFFRCFDGCVR